MYALFIIIIIIIINNNIIIIIIIIIIVIIIKNSIFSPTKGKEKRKKMAVPTIWK